MAILDRRSWLNTTTKYPAVFTSSTGPGLAHVVSYENHQAAWSAVSAKYLSQGTLIALVPGHHTIVMSGATLQKQASKEELCYSAG